MVRADSRQGGPPSWVAEIAETVVVPRSSYHEVQVETCTPHHHTLLG